MLLLALYRLKQAPRLFNFHLCGVLCKFGYTQSLSDPCVFYRRTKTFFSVLTVVVDDILHAASDESVITGFTSQMSSVYRMKHLGTPSLMVGINVTISDNTIRLNQSHCIRQLADKFKQTDSAPAASPATLHGCLGSSPVPESEPLDTSVFPYLSLVGSCLLYTSPSPRD